MMFGNICAIHWRHGERFRKNSLLSIIFSMRAAVIRKTIEKQRMLAIDSIRERDYGPKSRDCAKNDRFSH